MDPTLLSDPLFWAVAIPAALVVGISKGGFAGGLAMIATPLLALHIPALQAAAILLPVLVAMDWVGIIAYRKSFDKSVLIAMLPAAVLGIAIGGLTASWITGESIKLILGIISVVFAADYFLLNRAKLPPKKPNSNLAAFWGSLAGYTSFVAHAGGPPWQMYVAPLRLEKRIFAGTGVVFFTIVNAIKLIPYFILGQFNTATLKISLVMMPVAFAAVWLGIWLVKVVPEKPFYQITYIGILLVGLRLIWQSL